MAKKGLKTFTVYAKVVIECGIDIKAESLEDALAQAKAFKGTDFAEPCDYDHYNDSSMEITGASLNK